MHDFLSAVEGLADLVLWRDGGQRQARRNAWRAMVVDNARARARAEAEAALEERYETAQCYETALAR